MFNFNGQIESILNYPQIILSLLIWSIFWKGMALWRSATKRQLIWFMILMVVNTVGLLEIAYLVYLNKWDLDRGRLLAFLERKFKKGRRGK